MNTYMITLSGYDRSATAYGETPGKAKYNFFLGMGDLFDSFAEFLRFVKSIRLIHKFRPCDLFGDIEQFERMKEYRNIPFAFMGMKVILKSGSRGNIIGTIVGSNDSMNWIIHTIFLGVFALKMEGPAKSGDPAGCMKKSFI